MSVHNVEFVSSASQKAHFFYHIAADRELSTAPEKKIAGAGVCAIDWYFLFISPFSFSGWFLFFLCFFFVFFFFFSWTRLCFSGLHYKNVVFFFFCL